MSAAELSEELKGFIYANIDSVGKLEVLLLLAKHPERKWLNTEVSREVRGAEAATSRYLSELTSAGVIASDGSSPPQFQYVPHTPQLRRVVEELRSAYHTFSARIIHLIYNKSIEQIREFAQAFRIRKDSDDS